MPSSTLPASAYKALEIPTDTVKILTNLKPSTSPAPAASPNLLQNEPAKGPLALNESSITLYAELLLNIRTVTLFASLRTFHTRETKAQLAANGASITVSHEGESATICLPIKLQGGGDAALSIPPSPPSKDITLRLQMEEKEGSDLLSGMRAEERKANIVPWDGASLNAMKDVELVCKACHGILVRKGTVKEWRDLPNENWAEMMDFWHCHKPDEHHLHDHTHDAATGKKGYAAGNRLQALPGVGFVDLASLLLKEQDCEGVLVADSDQQSASPSPSLICRACTATLGALDSSADGWRIYKCSIGLRTPSSPSPTIYATQKWISARFLHLIENTGARKFHVHPPPTPPSQNPVPGLLLWVFTPDLLFSSTIEEQRRTDPTRAMKVFYEKKAWKRLEPGEPEVVGIEEEEMPASLFEELKRGLEESGGLMPEGSRMWRGWDVGLLGRFDVGEGDVVERESEDGTEGQRDEKEIEGVLDGKA